MFCSTRNIKTFSSKSDLLEEVKILTTLKSVPLKDSSEFTIELMEYTSKVVDKKKKLQIRTFGDFVKLLWTIFLSLSKSAERINILFDL